MMMGPMPMQNFPMQGMPMQGMPQRPATAPTAQWTPWQPPAQPQSPSLAYIAGGAPPAGAGPLPAKFRGVAPEAAPVPPPPPKFVLPTPEALGIATNIPMPSQASPPPAVDWNQVHARMERLGVLRYHKEAAPGGVRVTLLLPMADPSRAQPVEAVAQNEAAAVLAALERSEAWMRQR